MLSLFIMFVHGGKSNLKLVSKPLLSTSSVVTITVYYDDVHKAIEVSGCTIVKGWLDNQYWFKDAPGNRLALFQQLFDNIMKNFKFQPHQIYLSYEGNWSILGGNQLSPEALTVINYIKPRTVLLPVGTPECCKFIHYWMTYHEYPHLDLGGEFITPSDYYAKSELSPEKIEELEGKVGPMLITCPPPVIASFDKKKLLSCIPKLLARMMVANTDIGKEEMIIRSDQPVPHDQKDPFSLQLPLDQDQSISANLNSTNQRNYSRVHAFTSPGEVEDIGDKTPLFENEDEKEQDTFLSFPQKNAHLDTRIVHDLSYLAVPVVRQGGYPLTLEDKNFLDKSEKQFLDKSFVAAFDLRPEHTGYTSLNSASYVPGLTIMPNQTISVDSPSRPKPRSKLKKPITFWSIFSCTCINDTSVIASDIDVDEPIVVMQKIN